MEENRLNASFEILSKSVKDVEACAKIMGMVSDDMKETFIKGLITTLRRNCDLAEAKFD